MSCDPSPPGDGEQEAEWPSHFEPPRPKRTVERTGLDLSIPRAKTKENECDPHSYDAAGKKVACSQQVCFLAGVVFGRGGRESA